MEDIDIVNLFLSREEQALAETQAKYGSRLQRQAQEITGSTEEAQECLNDTLQKTWESIPPHTPYDYLYPFLVHINRNLALNLCRNRRASRRKACVEELTAELVQAIPGNDRVESIIDDLTLQKILNEFLGALSPERRGIFIRRYWYLDSIAAIAEGYALSESKVKTTLFRLRNQLKERLLKEGYYV